MIFHVYSKAPEENERYRNAEASWENQDVVQVPLTDNVLLRNIEGVPFIKDIFEAGAQRCSSDDDIILYTNYDIGVVLEKVEFPSTNFFLVRKNVKKAINYTVRELKNTPFENSINADGFGITKSWWDKNKHLIPDFVIGRPYWDLGFLMAIQGTRLDNVIFHVEHDSKWKSLHDDGSEHNKKSFFNFLKQKNIPYATKISLA